jgi:hypothetical protein
LASNAHAFTILSPLAGNQVWVNHLIQFENSMSKPTNESSCKPIFKTNQKKDLDAELLNNLLLPKKTQVTYSEPNQDAELPSKIIELTDTKTCGLCHDKNQGQNLLWISLVSMKRSIAQLL